MAHERFEQGAATWDDNPARVRNAETLASAILQKAEVSETDTVVDYGCGTGLVTLAVAPHVGRVIAIDSSPAMLSVLREKAQMRGLDHVATVQADLERDEPPTVEADLVLTTMVLHHVTDIPAVLRRLAAMVRPGGLLAVADLDAEDGSFHADRAGVVHFGFDRAWLRAQFEAAGLVQVADETANTLERDGPDGPRRYTVFLMLGTKR
jgi:ubiquinone/menaquinone biosynthesis C-methylase UbiE